MVADVVFILCIVERGEYSAKNLADSFFRWNWYANIVAVLITIALRLIYHEPKIFRTLNLWTLLAFLDLLYTNELRTHFVDVRLSEATFKHAFLCRRWYFGSE